MGLRSDTRGMIALLEELTRLKGTKIGNVRSSDSSCWTSGSVEPLNNSGMSDRVALAIFEVRDHNFNFSMVRVS
jgi:hypothetical protein